MNERCGLCPNLSADSLEFETGDDANYAVEMPLCEEHLAEAEKMGYAFDEKYAEQILERLYEDWRGMADAHE